MSALVENVIVEQPPGSGYVRLEMDFGNLPEIFREGGEVTACSVSVDSGALTAVTVSGVTVLNEYTVSALFSGGAVGEYAVTFTPTITFVDATTRVLPPRTATLKLV